ncbi:MAG: TIGR01459 family HAD-type hydrolase [Candidatus Liberibacter ctenarytainae]|uniref:TIGR01459 family HAD-type hydrolase n=1 Tax=Candidatus Liberibacter ctenarytainae TaxID=2020335 RepID=A0A937DH41_9HYPH|nr:TIGR01459 family HAD-type hydrolase [Candidatus Liberibacter ctenarytainae]
MLKTVTEITSLGQISQLYDIILCDVWGVLHNGIKLFPDSIDALQKARLNGLKVILLTNSPRPSSSVISHIKALGSSQIFWDDMITSGDLTYHLITKESPKIFFIGPARDHVLLEGLNIKIVDEKDAETIVCTGLYNDETETPEEYYMLLQRFARRKVPFICANPDIVANRGDKIIPCAGALAKIYQQLHGNVKMIGKPHFPIYEMALKKISVLCHSSNKKRILAIGDGIETDIKGALKAELDTLYVSRGIHMHEYLTHDQIDVPMMHNFFRKKNLYPHWWIQQLI